MPNYQNSKVYILLNSSNNIAYIGSTVCELSKRMGEHRSNVTQPEKMNRPLYVAMREIGVPKFWISLLEEYPCENKVQLHKREGWHIQKHEGELYNLCVAGRERKEYLSQPIIQKKLHDYHKQYREDNVDKLKELGKDYRAKNEEKIKEGKKVYYANHSDLVKKRAKDWYEAHKEAILAKDRQRYAAKKALAAQTPPTE